eukprot:TRINITY_DN1493_c0_g1_i1.p1 TRINITY_DN1493_c0_g1~~TRINITY_DN1493_c0_g1_i1.p1  ORF type:complete len:858 (+),score=159.60 TRINITY_DN1493_c0_g1_i1:2166-4739(+)
MGGFEKQVYSLLSNDEYPGKFHTEMSNPLGPTAGPIIHVNPGSDLRGYAGFNWGPANQQQFVSAPNVGARPQDGVNYAFHTQNDASGHLDSNLRVFRHRLTEGASFIMDRVVRVKYRDTDDPTITWSEVEVNNTPMRRAAPLTGGDLVTMKTTQHKRTMLRHAKAYQSEVAYSHTERGQFDDRLKQLALAASVEQSFIDNIFAEILSQQDNLMIAIAKQCSHPRELVRRMHSLYMYLQKNVDGEPVSSLANLVEHYSQAVGVGKFDTTIGPSGVLHYTRDVRSQLIERVFNPQGSKVEALMYGNPGMYIHEVPNSAYSNDESVNPFCRDSVIGELHVNADILPDGDKSVSYKEHRSIEVFDMPSDRAKKIPFQTQLNNNPRWDVLTQEYLPKARQCLVGILREMRTKPKWTTPTKTEDIWDSDIFIENGTPYIVQYIGDQEQVIFNNQDVLTIARSVVDVLNLNAVPADRRRAATTGDDEEADTTPIEGRNAILAKRLRSIFPTCALSNGTIEDLLEGSVEMAISGRGAIATPLELSEEFANKEWRDYKLSSEAVAAGWGVATRSEEKAVVLEAKVISNNILQRLVFLQLVSEPILRATAVAYIFCSANLKTHQRMLDAGARVGVTLLLPRPFVTHTTGTLAYLRSQESITLHIGPVIAGQSTNNWQQQSTTNLSVRSAAIAENPRSIWLAADALCVDYKSGRDVKFIDQQKPVDLETHTPDQGSMLVIVEPYSVKEYEPYVDLVGTWNKFLVDSCGSALQGDVKAPHYVNWRFTRSMLNIQHNTFVDFKTPGAIIDNNGFRNTLCTQAWQRQPGTREVVSQSPLGRFTYDGCASVYHGMSSFGTPAGPVIAKTHLV